MKYCFAQAWTAWGILAKLIHIAVSLLDQVFHMQCDLRRPIFFVLHADRSILKLTMALLRRIETNVCVLGESDPLLALKRLRLLAGGPSKRPCDLLIIDLDDGGARTRKFLRRLRKLPIRVLVIAAFFKKAKRAAIIQPGRAGVRLTLDRSKRCDRFAHKIGYVCDIWRMTHSSGVAMSCSIEAGVKGVRRHSVARP